MLHYQRYIAKGLIHTTLIVALSLTSIVWLMQALRLVDFIVNQGIPIYIFLKLAGLLLPSIFMLILPAACCIATMHFYYKLKVESELTVLQSSGLSRLQLARPALLVAIGFMAVGYSISLYFIAASYREFREMQFYLRNNYVSVLLQEGVFSTPVNGLMVYVRERDDDGVLRGILVHDNRNAEAPVTMMAENARLVNTAQGPRFLLANGNRQELQHGKLSFLEFDSYDLDISLYTNDMMDRSRDSEEKTITELMSEEPKDGVITPDYIRNRADAHQRIIWPAYALTLTAIVLAITLSGEFNRRQRWRRNGVALTLIAIVMFAAVGLKNLMGTNLMFVPLAYAALIAPFCLSLYSLTGGRFIIRRKTSRQMRVI